jgi:cbb3-type cytochrome oxidase maturation protein
MDTFFHLISISLRIGICFLGAFFWAFRTGQFEDTTTPGMRILDYPSENDATSPKTICPKK